MHVTVESFKFALVYTAGTILPVLSYDTQKRFFISEDDTLYVVVNVISSEVASILAPFISV